MIQTLNERALLARFRRRFYLLLLPPPPAPAPAPRLLLRLRLLRRSLLRRRLLRLLGLRLSLRRLCGRGLLLAAATTAAPAPRLLLRFRLLRRGASIRALGLDRDGAVRQHGRRRRAAGLLDADAHGLPDPRGRARHGDHVAVAPRDCVLVVVQMHVHELDLELLSGSDRERLRIDVGRLALREDLEVILAEAPLRLEGEPATRFLLELVEPRAARADEDPGDGRVQLDEEGLALRASDMGTKAPLDLDGVRLGRDHDAVPATSLAGDREDLPGAIGHVLAGHLDQPQRRDLDDVRLRPVPLQLGVEGVLHQLPVLRIRHVDEVDDDDPADVTEAQLADDLLDGLEVVLRDRVLEAGGPMLSPPPPQT